jgi:hypothetical protein
VKSPFRFHIFAASITLKRHTLKYYSIKEDEVGRRAYKILLRNPEKTVRITMKMDFKYTRWEDMVCCNLTQDKGSCWPSQIY